MLKFDSNNIFTGYIKQLLADFNLPTYKIYTRENAQYLELNDGVESPAIFESVTSSTKKYKQHIYHFPYIKAGSIYKYMYTETTDPEIVASQAAGKYTWTQVGSYFPGQKILNNTKNLKIKNNIYDTYTHEYLGEYLRFIRDYYDMDLMPLYNCFSNKVCDNILLDTTAAETGAKFSFDSDNTDYKIFMLPVKLSKNYTIAISCGSTVEMCCGLYNKYNYDSPEYIDFAQDTYRKYTQLKFNQPILYTALTEIFQNKQLVRPNILDIARNEDDLKLFIKLPASTKSSIVILEGDYRGYNDEFIKYEIRPRLEKKPAIRACLLGMDCGACGYNTCDEYAEAIATDSEVSCELCIPGGNSVAARIKAILNQPAIRKHYQNHTITNFEDVENNTFITAEDFYDTRTFKPITKLELLSMDTGESYPFANKLIEYLVDNVITELDETEDNIARVQKVVADWTNDRVSGIPGVWDPRIRPVVYNYIVNKFDRPEINHDVLGYVDKSVETNFSAVDILTGQENSIANVDIYDDLYLALKRQK